MPEVPKGDRELYVLEKLGQAVEVLVTHPDRVWERLEEANRHLVAAQPKDVADDELRRMFAGIKDDLARLEDLNAKDASDLAARVLSLHNQLKEQLILYSAGEEGRRLRASLRRLQGPRKD